MKLSRRDPGRHAAEPAEPVAPPTPTPAELQFAQVLIADRAVTDADVTRAAATMRSRGTLRLGQALVRNGAIGENALADALAAHLGLDALDLRSVSPEQGAVDLLGEEHARRLGALPLDLDGPTLRVAVFDPLATTSADLGALTGTPVALVVSPESEVRRAIGIAYRALAGVDSKVQTYEAQDAIARDAEAQAAEVDVADAPVVDVVNRIITQALRDRASDVHLEPQGTRLRVRFRIDGALNDVLDLPGSMAPVVVSRLKIMADMNIVERRRPQDGQISMDVEGRGVDIRVASTPTIGGEKVVLRLLDKSRPLYQLQQLGMPPETVTRFDAMLRAPYGMVICAGPTGSGKTTTLYGSLGAINSSERNIMTIEDPVEYTFDSINQIQINEAAGLTFASGLRSILRQDPDVILVGEVRDVETARIAVQSALTGHFVLSSLHATDAVSALHRLLDMGIEPFLVSSSVTAVVAQRLVRRICTYCKQSYEPSREDLAILDSLGGARPPDGFARGAGCNFCSQTGYLERTGVYELMAVTDEIRQLVLTGAAHDELRKLARVQGMNTLQEEALQLVEAGVTTLAEIMRSIYVLGS